MNKLYLYLSNDCEDILIGTLFFEYKNNQEQFSFEYSDSYLALKNQFNIDPKLLPYKGRQFANFGFIQDMIPDRFGKLLINKEEDSLASIENRVPRKLNAFDYLLKTNDLSRMGGLRVKEEENGPFLNNSLDSFPSYIYLRDIESASIQIDANEDVDNLSLRRLLLPGSSLGGARPKCNIYYCDNAYIAKFPSKKDNYDVELLECITLKIADLCGLNVPNIKLEQYSNIGHTLLIKRFDRENGKRIHYMSAVTALGASDGESDNYSYLDLINFIKAEGTDIKENLTELYKRMVFTYLINDTDNHLRNHAFILKGNRYVLSPIFDINPTIYETSFELPFGGVINKSGIIEESRYFNLSKIEADSIYNRIGNIIVEQLEKYKEEYKEIGKLIDRVLKITKARL